MPQGLEPSVAVAWETFWQTDFSRIVNWERDREALTRLFEMYSLRRKLLAACEEVLLVGSQGQTVLNPALRHLATIDGSILQLERQFGFTPQSAGALGLTLTGLRKSLDERNREANQVVRKNA